MVLSTIHEYRVCCWPVLFTNQRGGRGRSRVVSGVCVQLECREVGSCSQQLVSWPVEKCLYRKTLWGVLVERLCVTTNVKGASSPRMYIVGTKRKSREEKVRAAGREFWPAVEGRMRESARRREGPCSACLSVCPSVCLFYLGREGSGCGPVWACGRQGW
jgi:hypothetical protein